MEKIEKYNYLETIQSTEGPEMNENDKKIIIKGERDKDIKLSSLINGTNIKKDLNKQMKNNLHFKNKSMQESFFKKDYTKMEESQNNIVINENKTNIDSTVINCIICFEKTPDCLFMECGHGGSIVFN